MTKETIIVIDKLLTKEKESCKSKYNELHKQLEQKYNTTKIKNVITAEEKEALIEAQNKMLASVNAYGDFARHQW